MFSTDVKDMLHRFHHLYMKNFLLIIFIIFVIAMTAPLALGRYFCWEWVGVAKYETITLGGVSSQKCKATVTFWDLVELLLVPIALSGGAWFISQGQKNIAEKKEQEEKHQKYYEDYLDKTWQILSRFDDFQHLKNHENAKNFLEALTVTALKSLDPDRKGDVIEFLYRAGLIVDDVNVINLDNADLSRINLQDRFLAGINLSGSNLSNANLKNVFLGGRFRSSDLSGIKLVCLPSGLEIPMKLEGIYVSSNLSKADLTNANLTDAKLDNTDFNDATWKGAILKGARLKGAKMDIETVRKEAKIDESTVFPDIENSEIR